VLDEYNEFREFWTPFFVFITLLGVYLIILGIALGGLVSALRKREVEKTRLKQAQSK
jgi:hypothetical protein